MLTPHTFNEDVILLFESLFRHSYYTKLSDLELQSVSIVFYVYRPLASKNARGTWAFTCMSVFCRFLSKPETWILYLLHIFGKRRLAKTKPRYTEGKATFNHEYRYAALTVPKCFSVLVLRLTSPSTYFCPHVLTLSLTHVYQWISNCYACNVRMWG